MIGWRFFLILILMNFISVANASDFSNANRDEVKCIIAKWVGSSDSSKCYHNLFINYQKYIIQRNFNNEIVDSKSNHLKDDCEIYISQIMDNQTSNHFSNICQSLDMKQKIIFLSEKNPN